VDLGVLSTSGEGKSSSRWGRGECFYDQESVLLFLTKKPDPAVLVAKASLVRVRRGGTSHPILAPRRRGKG